MQQIFKFFFGYFLISLNAWLYQMNNFFEEWKIFDNLFFRAFSVIFRNRFPFFGQLYRVAVLETAKLFRFRASLMLWFILFNTTEKKEKKRRVRLLRAERWNEKNISWVQNWWCFMINGGAASIIFFIGFYCSFFQAKFSILL